MINDDLFCYRPPMDPYLDILYRDNDLLFLNKPAELLSVPGRDPAHHDSLASRVLRVFPDAKVVHRLDMATSGVVMMAMHKRSQSILGRAFSLRQIHKSYLAWISGELLTSQGSIDLPLRCDWPSRPRQMVDHTLGKPSQTHYRRLAVQGGNTLVQLFPITGRSHQLRVHMQAVGHPILGDKLYAEGDFRNHYSRLHLHATSLCLTHPMAGSTLRIKAPIPFDMAGVDENSLLHDDALIFGSPAPTRTSSR